MKYIHAYKLDEGKTLNDLHLLTQLLSILKLKVSTNSNIELYVDDYTLSEFKKFGIEKLYDNVDTKVLESYPSKKISKQYSSSYKVWVMKHQEDPFCILDTDLVLHNIKDDVFEKAKVSFLYPVSSTNYPFPTILNKPKNFNWTDREIVSFGNSLPVSTSVVAFNDMDFLKEYTDRYFEFVLGNKGGISVKGFDYYTEGDEQLTMEHWLLSSMIWDKKHDNFGNYVEGFSTQSLTSAISFPLGLNHQMYNIQRGDLLKELSAQVFHLLSAKDFYDKAIREDNNQFYLQWDNLKKDLLSANNDFIQYLKKQEYFDILEKIEEYCREIPKGIN